MYLPEKIQALVGDASYTCDSIGKSGAAVLCWACESADSLIPPILIHALVNTLGVLAAR